MGSFINLQDPHIQGLLLVQVVGFPVAFLVRTIIWAMRARKLQGHEQKRGTLNAAANLCFALTSITFVYSMPIGGTMLAVGVYLSVRSLLIARQAAEEAQMKTTIKKKSRKSTRHVNPAARSWAR